MRQQGKHVVCSDGERFPLSSLGMQAARWHEEGLTRVRRPSPFSLSLTWRDTTVTLHTHVLSVSRRHREPGSTQTWYPLHICWQRGRRHFKVRRTREPLGARR